MKDYSEEELELFLYSPQIRLKNPPEGWPKTAKYEGLVHRMYRSVLNSEEGKLHRELLDPITSHGVCPECNGARLNQKVLSCKIDGKNIADVIKLPLFHHQSIVPHPSIVSIIRGAVRGLLK